MFRLNNKGFAISGVVYSILLLFVILLYALLSVLANRKVILDKTKNDILKDLDHNSAQVQKFRYVRDYLNGNSLNNYNHWIEVQVFDFNNNLISSGKTVTTSYPPTIGSGGSPASALTDGIINSSNFIDMIPDPTGVPRYVEIDLGGSYEIGKVIVWHYYEDGRTYHDTKTVLETSDRSYTKAIFDSTNIGEYTETASGNTIIVPH